MEFENKSSPDIGLLKEFRDFLNNWRGRSIKEVIFDHENEVDERFLPFEESPPSNVSSHDLHGFALEWTRQVLHSLNCPRPFTDAVARLVIKEYYSDFEVEPQRNIEAAHTLWPTVISQVDEMLQQLAENEESVYEGWNMLQDDSKKYSVFAIKNGRRSMEDVHVTVSDLNSLLGTHSDPPTGYYAVFDGHAGNKAACFAATHLHHKIANIPIYRTDMKEAIRQGIRETDDSFIAHCNNREQGCKSGCTAICCFIRPTKLWLAWVGDSQGVVFGGGQPVFITLPHKPEREDEKARIEKLGGCVVHMGTWRVNGTLAVSRAIGDIENKPYITSEPDVVELDLNGTEDFVLLACDGMWDVLNDDDVSNIAYSYFGTFAKESDGPGLAAKLVTEAKKRGSSDNITIVVVYLQDYARLHETYIHLGLSELSCIPESPLVSMNEAGLLDNLELMENKNFSGFTTFNQTESQSFHMENISSYSKTEFSQKWSTDTNEQSFGAVSSSATTSAEISSENGNDFGDFHERFSQKLLQQSEINSGLDEADFTRFESSTFYNKSVDIENPLRDVFEGSTEAIEFSLGGLNIKQLEGGELAEEQLETGKFSSDINWNDDESAATKEVNFLESFEAVEGTKSASPKPYFESNLSPDAEPFVSRYQQQNQAFSNDFQQDAEDYVSTSDFNSDFSSCENQSQVTISNLNPFAAELNFEKKSTVVVESDKISEHENLFDDYLRDDSKEVTVETELKTLSPTKFNVFEAETETYGYQKENVVHEELPAHSPMQNVTFQPDVMVPEVKLIYSESASSDNFLSTEIDRNVASPIIEIDNERDASPAFEINNHREASPVHHEMDVSPIVEGNPFESDSFGAAQQTYRHEEFTFEAKTDFEDTSFAPNAEAQGKSIIETNESENFTYSEQPDILSFDQHETFEFKNEEIEVQQNVPKLTLTNVESENRHLDEVEMFASSVLETAKSENISAVEEVLVSSIEGDFDQTGVTDNSVVDVDQELHPYEHHIPEDMVLITETESQFTVSPKVEIELPTAAFEQPSEVKQPILEALSAAADVEDDESEDGEGWKFYPTETPPVVASSGDVNLTTNVQETQVTVTSGTIEIEPVAEIQAVEMTPLTDELILLSKQAISLPLKPVEPVTKQLKSPLKPKASAAKTKVLSSKTTAKVEVKASTSKTTTKPLSKPLVKEVKKIPSAAKTAPKAAASATAPKVPTSVTLAAKITKAPAAAEPLKLKSTIPAASKISAATTGVVATKKPSAQAITKRAVNGTTAKDTLEKPKSATTKPSEGTVKTTVKKTTTTVVKSTAPVLPKESLAIKKPIASAKTNNGTLSSRTATNSATLTLKADHKQAKETLNKNLSGSGTKASLKTVSNNSTTKATTTSSSAKVETSVTSKVSTTSSSTTTKTSTIKSQLVNGGDKKELASPSKTKTTVGTTKSFISTLHKSSPVAGTSTRLSPNKFTSPVARSSPVKATSPTTPKARTLAPGSKTSSSATKSITKSSVTKKLTSTHVEKGTIDARSKEISMTQVIKNGDCSVGADQNGEPKIELELQNGFGKLDNGIHDEVDFRHTSTNGSIIDTENMMLAAGD